MIDSPIIMSLDVMTIMKGITLSQLLPRFDRSGVMTLLQRRLSGFQSGYRQNLALIGPEGVGKTTLLKRFLGEEVPSDSMVSVYFEVRAGESLLEAIRRFGQILLYGVLRTKGFRSLPSDPEGLWEAAAVWVPETTVALRRLIRRAQVRQSTQVFSALWDLPQIVSQEMGLRCIICLDEFHRLADYPVQEPLRCLGRKIMVQNDTLFLLCSSEPAVSRSILKEGLNLLFGQFEEIKMGLLEPRTALGAIRSVLSDEEKEPWLEHGLMELGQGHPACLDLLLSGWMNTEASGAQKWALLLESLFLSPGGRVRQLFEQKIDRLPMHRNRSFWIQLLQSVASGVHQPARLADELDRPMTQVTLALRVLEREDFLVRRGAFFLIPDRLFEVWMQVAFPILQGIGLIDMEQAKTRFREEIAQWLERIRLRSQRPMEDHLLDWVKGWGGESIQMEGRRMVLPRFDRVSLISGLGGRPVLVAHRIGKRAGKGWIIIPWAGDLRGEATRLFVQAVQESPFKDYRKVVAGPTPIEFHARLILQEAKIRLWDLGTLNELLSLYGMDRIPYWDSDWAGVSVLPWAVPDSGPGQLPSNVQKQ